MTRDKPTIRERVVAFVGRQQFLTGDGEYLTAGDDFLVDRAPWWRRRRKAH